MDSAFGRCTVYFVAVSRSAFVHLGTTEVRGQFNTQSMSLSDIYVSFDSQRPVDTSQNTDIQVLYLKKCEVFFFFCLYYIFTTFTF